MIKNKQNNFIEEYFLLYYRIKYVFEHQLKHENYIAYFKHNLCGEQFKWYYCYSCARRNNINIYIIDDLYPIDWYSLNSFDITISKISNLIYHKIFNKLISNTM